jgi:arginyl-tRNA synthetase
MNVKQQIDHAIVAALTRAGAPDSPAVVKQAQRPEFGHYQVNGVMGAAKKIGSNPRELANKVLEIAGPGFINIQLDPGFISRSLNDICNTGVLCSPGSQVERIAVDYSAPNLMKEMHIGHLRTTAIGDAIVRVLEYLGQDVIRVNHVGDWGAQFGSLLAYLDQLDQDKISTELKDLERFYRAASTLFKTDEAFAARARDYVVRLQGGDETCLRLWRLFIEESIDHCQTVYEKLDITLSRDDIYPESSYNDDLPIVVAELQQKGLLVESDGAQCVFLDEFKGKDDKPLPAIVRKSDGGYPYMATDLAALRHRTGRLHVDKALYVVGAPQQLHLRQVFAVGRAAGYLNDQDFRHLPFGSILKEDGKPFKTRDGADVKLIDVVDESVQRALRLVVAKNPDLSAEEHKQIAHVVGVGAMKYAELSKNRTTDYVFDWDTLLSFEGNTAPYLQYAYTRIRSIFKRAGLAIDGLEGDIALTENAEIQLGIKLLQFPETLDTVLDDYQMNLLCNYLFELASQFMSFYESCPILKAEPAIRDSRLKLADVTARVLQQGLSLLGISTVERM